MLMNLFKSAGLIGVLVAVIVIFLLFPLAYIWALNVLFPSLAIQYTFETWLAAVVLAGLFRATVSNKKD